MNHKEQIDHIAAASGESKAAVERVLNAQENLIKEQLKNAGGIALHGLGTLDVVDRSAREGRNPATGEALHIPAKKAVRFKPGKALRDSV